MTRRAEHWPALEAFLSVCSQWRMVTAKEIGTRTIGLDYGAVEVGLRFAGIEMNPALWSEVQLIEQGARGAMNDT